MQFRIRVEHDVAAEGSRLTAELADWLAEHPRVGPYMRIRRVRESAPDAGRMSGDLIGWLEIATTAAFSVPALVYAHMAWRDLQHRPAPGPAPTMTSRTVIERGEVRVILENASAETVVDITRALEGGSSGAPSGDDSDGHP
ncbi:hypothetical protein [Embleya sp. NPDC020886]|uniref:effector-associated constant component EACC1 n=1 Tax=Embleya sp. NPDC020886 TaxID=3363980 RepID=UPI00379633E9